MTQNMTPLTPRLVPSQVKPPDSETGNIVIETQTTTEKEISLLFKPEVCK